MSATTAIILSERSSDSADADAVIANLLSTFPSIPLAGHIPFMALGALFLFLAIRKAVRTPDGDRPPRIAAKTVGAVAIGAFPFFYNAFVSGMVSAAVS